MGQLPITPWLNETSACQLRHGLTRRARTTSFLAAFTLLYSCKICCKILACHPKLASRRNHFGKNVPVDRNAFALLASEMAAVVADLAPLVLALVVGMLVAALMV